MDVVFTVGAYDVLAMALRTFAVPLDDDLLSSDHETAPSASPTGSRRPTASPRSATTTPTSTLSRPSCSGPGSGRWRAGSRRSPAPATTSSTRSWTTPSWWCATDRGRSGPSRTRAATAGSRSLRAAARSRAASPAPSTAGATASTAPTPSSRGPSASLRRTWRRARSTWSRCVASSGAAVPGSTSTRPPHPCGAASSPSPPSSTPGRLDSMRTEWWHAFRLPVNWKLAQEAFLEQYHVIETHPELVIPKRFAPKDPATFDPESFIDAELHYLHVMSEGMAGMVHANDVAVAEGQRTMELPEDPKGAMETWHSHPQRRRGGLAPRQGRRHPRPQRAGGPGHRRDDVLLLPALLRPAHVLERLVLSLPPPRTRRDPHGDLVAHPLPTRCKTPSPGAPEVWAYDDPAGPAHPHPGLLQPAPPTTGPAQQGLRVHAPLGRASRAASPTSSAPSTATWPASPTTSWPRPSSRQPQPARSGPWSIWGSEERAQTATKE